MPATIAVPHPGAWWLWALVAVTVVTITTDIVLIGTVIVAVGTVGVTCGTSEGSGRRLSGWWIYAALGLTILVTRLVFHVVLGVNRSGTVIFELPRVPLPDWAAGISFGGPVTVQGLTAAGAEGLRLAAIIAAIGAASVLASPRRAIRLFPAALGEVTTAVAIAVTVAPQLVESALRVQRARRLRSGQTSRRRLLRMVVLPVFADAIDRSVSLAEAMEARGYGATSDARRVPARIWVVMAGGLALLAFGVFALLGLPRAGWWPVVTLAAGAAAVGVAIALSGRRLAVTRYRPQRWSAVEWGIVAGGAVALGAALVATWVLPAAIRPPIGTWQVPSPVVMGVPLALVAVAAVVRPVRLGRVGRAGRAVADASAGPSVADVTVSATRGGLR